MAAPLAEMNATHDVNETSNINSKEGQDKG